MSGWDKCQVGQMSVALLSVGQKSRHRFLRRRFYKKNDLTFCFRFRLSGSAEHPSRAGPHRQVPAAAPRSRMRSVRHLNVSRTGRFH
jgi:hypothetical protein